MNAHKKLEESIGMSRTFHLTKAQYRIVKILSAEGSYAKKSLKGYLYDTYGRPLIIVQARTLENLYRLGVLIKLQNTYILKSGAQLHPTRNWVTI